MPDYLSGLLTIVVLCAALALCYVPVGDYLAHVFTTPEDLWIERKIYRFIGIASDKLQSWRGYLLSVMTLSFVSIAMVTALLINNKYLPTVLGGGTPVHWYDAINIAVSLVTATNGQWCFDDNTLSYPVEFFGLIEQNFVSAAVGLSVAIALIRGFSWEKTDRLGNFWVDFTRAIIRIFIPIALVAGIILLSQGVIFSFPESHLIHTVTGAEQKIPGGIIAPLEAMKEIGTNGGGFFDVNSAHPFENPNPYTNILEIFLILFIPFSLPRTLGTMTNNNKQGLAVLASMATIFGSILAIITYAELHAPDKINSFVHGVTDGKETQFGVWGTTLFTTAGTGTTAGSLNSSLDANTALGNLGALINILLGELAPGGVGSGLYGMIILTLFSVYTANIIIGKTPVFLGKRIESTEISCVSIYLVVMPIAVVAAMGLAVGTTHIENYVSYNGPHGFSELLYTFASAAHNNGSSFSTVHSYGAFFATILTSVMLIGRFIPIIIVLCLASFLAQQKKIPIRKDHLPTHRPIFISYTVAVIILLTGASYTPAVALGPIIETLI